MKNRRVQVGAAVAVVGLVALASFMAKPRDEGTTPSGGGAKVAEWADEYAIGAPNAPVQVIEYASLTCPHCAHFAETAFPQIKAQYVDTGKVRFIARAYPLDAFAVSAFMAARCLPHEKYFDAMDLIYKTQPKWAFASQDGDVIMNSLADVMRQAGMSRSAFDACLKNTAVLERIRKEQLDGEERFRVSSTPTFVVNGEVQSGDMTFENFKKIIDPLLPKESEKPSSAPKSQ